MLCGDNKVMRRLFHLLAFACMGAMIHVAAHAASIEINQANLVSSEDGYKLAASFDLELGRGLEDALLHGIPLHFTTVVEMSRPRWYWFDEKSIEASQTVRISYNVLTRQYSAAIPGSLQRNFSTLDEALFLVRRPGRWKVAGRGSLSTGQTYTVSVRMVLDTSQLPKPFQVDALNNRDWRLSSDWKRFLYRP
jgi:hypothetical protein